MQSLPNGIRVQGTGESIEATALCDDVLRVRLWTPGQEPENASWAVLPAALHSTASVKPEAHGFNTGKLQVVVAPDLSLSASDLKGHLLQEDAEPLMRRGKDFRVYKRSTVDDHFFGLGDKPGPLDRAGEAFTMWNTDYFGWQESTDPIYKSSFAYRKGDYARVRFSCCMAQDGSMTLQVALQEGGFAAWWTQYQVEIYGWTPRPGKASLGGKSIVLEHNPLASSVTIRPTRAERSSTYSGRLI